MNRFSPFFPPNLLRRRAFGGAGAEGLKIRFPSISNPAKSGNPICLLLSAAFYGCQRLVEVVCKWLRETTLDSVLSWFRGASQKQVKWDRADRV